VVRRAAGSESPRGQAVCAGKAASLSPVLHHVQVISGVRGDEVVVENHGGSHRWLMGDG
jgi:hypothetical protein